MVAGLLVVGLVAGPASSHASLVSSDPPDGARLDQPPAKVVLTFSEEISPKLAQVEVAAANGDTVTEGDPAVDGAVVTQRLKPALDPGGYTVAFRVVSADGHPVSDELTFRITGPSSTTTSTAVSTPTVSTSTTTTTTSATSGSGAPSGTTSASGTSATGRDTGPGLGTWLAIGAVAALLVGAMVVLVTRRRGGEHDSVDGL